MRSNAKFVLRKSVLHEHVQKLKEHCDIISYSAKTNYLVTEILENESDCQFSIHSPKALETVKDASRTWYFAQAWDTEELDGIFTRGVRRVVVDNILDLDRLLAYLDTHPERKIHLLLRMRLQEHTVHTGKYYVYGMYSHVVNRLVSELKDHAQIEAIGVHFHRKSQNVSEWNLQYELQDLLKPETLEAISYLNMGGGIPARYKNFRANVHDRIFAEMDKLRTWLHEHNIQLICEPGRYIAAPCVELHTTVELVYENNIVLNCSVFNACMDTFVVHQRLIIKGELEKGQAYTVKGKTPDSMDIFRYRTFLDNPQVGDTLIFLNAGAYSYSTDFCGLEPLETEVIE